MNKLIAITGISFELPNIKNWEELNRSIQDTSTYIGDLPSNRKKDVFARFDQFNIKEAGFLDRIDLFDNKYFDYTEKETLKIFPEHRFMLMHSLRAFYASGYTEKHLKGSNTGIIFVTSPSKYGVFLDGDVGEFNKIPGLEATRIANYLDLRGPIISVNTTCSSSLVAIHQACLSLIHGDCKQILVGGVKLGVRSKDMADKSVVSSKQGKCKPFDNEADGTLGGEGIVCMVLKNYEDAKKDRDPIYALIEGSAINHGGARITSLTAPSSEAQKEVLLKAWKGTRINPNDIRYIEAHGSGTILGDPIEFEGIKRAFKDGKSTLTNCSISSFKAQIGHLDVVSGFAGLLRLIAGLNFKTIPLQVGLENINKLITEENGVSIQRKSEPWPAGKDNIRVGGVSSFGLTGTNVHTLVSQKEPQEPQEKEDVKYYFIQLSEKSKIRLTNLKKELVHYLTQKKDIDLVNFSKKINRIYSNFSYKEGILFSSKKELLNKLSLSEQKRTSKEQFFLLNLDFLSYDLRLIEDILEENLLIKEEWDKLVKDIDLTNIYNNKIILNFLFQCTVCKYLLSVLGKQITIVTKKDGNLLHEILHGKATINDVIQNQELIKESLETFNKNSFIDYLIKNCLDVKVVLINFGRNQFIDEIPKKIETIWIDGKFSRSNRYNLYNELISVQKRPLKVHNNETLIYDLPLPVFDLKRFWPEDTIELSTLTSENSPKKEEEVDNTTQADANIEQRVRKIWKETLEIENEINLNDDFFYLGGDSLSGLDMLEDIKKIFEIDLSYEDMLTHTTLNEMIELLKERMYQVHFSSNKK